MHRIERRPWDVLLGLKVVKRAAEQRRGSSVVPSFSCYRLALMLATTLVLSASCAGEQSRPPLPPGTKIKGLNPAQICSELSHDGFTVQTNFSAAGKLWVCQENSNLIWYRVELLSTDTVSVEGITVEANSMHETMKIENARLFLRNMATLRYEGADSAKAAQWLDAHFDDTSAETVISGVRLELTTPNVYARKLTLTPAPGATR